MINVTKSLKESFRFPVLAGAVFVAFSVLGAPLFAEAAVLTRQLEIEMSGPDVSTPQTFLAKDSTIYPQGLVTGYFGFLTKSAVSNFQSRNGIDAVGRVGPITLVAINNQMNNGMTSGLDRRAPVISGVNVSVVNTNATFSWNTNENAAALVYYSTSPLLMAEASINMGVNISGSTLLVHNDLRMTHSGTLTALQSNTRYYYVIYSRDGDGNVSVTTQQSFQTGN
ncbi:MAG TPA: peptidoglycan-binding protein [Candidatus Paceibacterota bacterium]